MRIGPSRLVLEIVAKTEAGEPVVSAGTVSKSTLDRDRPLDDVESLSRQLLA